jgi:hypothetical protein
MWTYDPTLPTPKDQVRFLMGDTIAEDPQMQDEEIDALLTATGGAVGTAAVVGVRSLAAKYSRQADYWVGDLKLLASQRAQAYLRLGGQLAEMGESLLTISRVHQIPFAGGISVSQKELLALDADWPPTSFKKGMHDNCGGD